MTDPATDRAPRTAVGITGATGFLGGSLVRAFVRDGVDVVAFVRDPARARVPAGVQVRPYELGLDLPDLRGVAALVHCAFAPATARDDRVALNVASALALAREAAAQGVRFAFVSSISAGAETDSAYARQKRAIEQGLGPDSLVLRPGLIAGPGGLFGTLVRLSRLPVVPLLDGGGQAVQLVAVDDVYAALRLALDSGLTGVHTLVSEPALTMRTIVRELGRLGGRRPLLIGIPSAMAYSAAAIAERLGVALPVTAENIRGLRGARVQPASRALLERGWEPRAATAVLSSFPSNAAS